jgi:hypothetical protein
MAEGRQKQSEEKADKRKGNRSCNVSKPVSMRVYGALIQTRGWSLCAANGNMSEYLPLVSV